MTDFVPFPDPDLVSQALPGDDFASGGTVKVVVTGSVDGQTLVKEATKDLDAVVPGFAIGNVTVTGDTSPEINTATTYTATFDGGNDADLFNVTYNWSVLGLQGSTLTSIGNTAQIEFDSDAVSYTVRCTVDADNASDGPVNGDLVVTPASPGSQTSIGTVTISGEAFPSVGVSEVYTANIVGGDATNLSYAWTVTSTSAFDIIADGNATDNEVTISFDDAGANYTIDVEVTSGDANWDGVTQSDDLLVATPTPPPPSDDWSGTAPGYDSTSRPTPAPTWGLINDTGFITSSGQALKDTYLVDEFYLTSNNRPILIFRNTPGGQSGVSKRSTFQSLIPDTSTFTFEYDGNTASTEKNVGGSWGNQSLTDGAATRMPVTDQTALSGLVTWLQDGANAGKTLTLNITPA